MTLKNKEVTTIKGAFGFKLKAPYLKQNLHNFFWQCRAAGKALKVKSPQGFNPQLGSAKWEAGLND